MAGVVKEGDTNHLTRLLFRVSRGKVASFFQNIGPCVGQGEQSVQFGAKQQVSYAAYVLVFSDNEYLSEKVLRIAHSFSGINVD